MIAVAENNPTSFSETSTVPLWLDGKPVTTSTTFDLVSPLTEKRLYKVSAATESDAFAAIAAAEKAFPGWSQTKPDYRREIFLRAAEELKRRKDEFWTYCHTETASTEPYFAFEYGDALEALTSCAGLLSTALEGRVPTVGDAGRSAMVVPEPFGVVVAIAPWNAPCILGLRAFLGPLAMGNTVVLKGPEKAPACYWAWADLFHKVGLPPGCLNTIIHRPEDGAKITTALISSSIVKKVNFTGSTAVGAKIASIAGQHLKPVLMELGGKAPAIVCEDANLELAARQCAVGAFLNSGQICMSTERILVNSKVIDTFRSVLKTTIDQVYPAGSGLVLVDKLPVTKNRALLQDAVSKGAKPLYGNPAESLSLSTAMRPVVIEGVEKGMDLYYEESFGPTVSLFAVENDEEAIKIANDTDYGLASAVFSEDLRRAFTIARQIETGAVHINSMTVHDEQCLPHGGAKHSGWGRFNGLEGLKEWTRLKTITWKD